MNNKVKRRTRLARVKTGKLNAGTHLISSNAERNMGMFVAINEESNGKASNTFHAPLDKTRPSQPFKHEKKIRVGGTQIAKE